MRAVFTDLDGSLRHHRLGIHQADRASLTRLGQAGIARIIATGRSLHAAQKVLEPDFPIDFLIFSSGAGILDWPSQTLLQSQHLNQAEMKRSLEALEQLRLDFMLHAPLPDNHLFWYQQHSDSNPDFEARLALYPEFAQPLEQACLPEICTQLIAVVAPEQSLKFHQSLSQKLPDLSIIRATSPLDQRSGWLEIFPAKVSKSQASHWLRERFGWQNTMALGNDYNDLDLLEWSDRAFIAATAPEELKQQYEVVNCPSEAGFSQALARWLPASP